MDYFIWGLTILLILVGVAGVILPALPGVTLILIAAIIHKIFLPDILSWWTVIFIAFGVALSTVVEWLCIAAGNKWVGATRWAFLGAALGFLVGIFFSLPGMILGPILGALLAEWIIARRTILDASKAGVATGVSILVATISRSLIALVMILVLIIDWVWK